MQTLARRPRSLLTFTLALALAATLTCAGGATRCVGVACAAETGAAPPSVTLDSDILAGLEPRAIGPAAMGGRIAAIDAVPGEKLTIWIGSAGGGVWRSTDAGTTFKSMFDEHTQSIGAVAIDHARLYRAAKDAVRARDVGGGLDRARKCARVDRLDRNFPEHAREALRLLVPRGIHRRALRALDALLAIPVRLAVAHEDEVARERRGQARPCPHGRAAPRSGWPRRPRRGWCCGRARRISSRGRGRDGGAPR